MVADADGTHQVTIAADVWDASVPSRSRDGRNLLFAHSTEGTDLSERLYVAPADGSTPPARLPHDPGFAAGASYSPDGALIAYETGTFEGGQALWLAKADGSEARRLTTGRYYDIGGGEQVASDSTGSRTAARSSSLPARTRPMTSTSSVSHRGRMTARSRRRR
jgi:Tol biopolymer transport system component